MSIKRFLNAYLKLTFLIILTILFIFTNLANSQEVKESKLFIHGFLTQAWAYGWENQYFGIPKDQDTFGLRKEAQQSDFHTHLNLI